MGTTVSGPSITVDETAEAITLTAGATPPAEETGKAIVWGHFS